MLEEEVRRRDEDLARLHAWEAAVADLSDPEVDAARAYARSVFDDLLADAADEADRRDRAAARRAATTGAVTVLAPAPTPVPRAAPALVLPVAATGRRDRHRASDDADVDRDEPARLVPSLLAVTPVSANTRPTPLVSPATGPTVIDRDAFAAVLRAHRAEPTPRRPRSTPVGLTEDARRRPCPRRRPLQTTTRDHRDRPPRLVGTRRRCRPPRSRPSVTRAGPRTAGPVAPVRSVD